MTQPARVADSHSENSTTVRTRETPAERSAALEAARTALKVARAASPDAAAALALRMFITPRRLPRPAREHDALARARHFLIPFRSEALAAWEWGEAGPRVLVVHGWEGRAAQLAPIAEALAARGFRVVGFDAPAHGDSPGSRASFFDFAESIEAAVRCLGPLHAVVAHSMGGASMTWAARSRGLALRYVTIAPPADLRDFSRAFAGFMELDDDVRERMNAAIEARWGVKLDDVVVEQSARGMRAPLLVVHDLADEDVPFDKGRRLAAAWPGAALLRTEGLGHQRILRDPEVIRAVERFVAFGVTPAT